MQDRPTYNELLHAVAEFLDHAIPRAIEDPALRLRARVGANILKIVERELAHEEEDIAAELARLAAAAPELVSGAVVPADLAGRRAALMLANAGLSRQIAAGHHDGELATPGEGPIWQHLRQTLAEKLRVVNPRFDTSPIIESREPA